MRRMTVPTPRLPGGTITLMFTDLVGSTARWESDPDGMREVLAHHDAAAVASIERCGGQLIKRTGDGTFSVFTDAAAAVRAALEVQDRVDPGLGQERHSHGLDGAIR